MSVFRQGPRRRPHHSARIQTPVIGSRGCCHSAARPLGITTDYPERIGMRFRVAAPPITARSERAPDGRCAAPRTCRPDAANDLARAQHLLGTFEETRPLSRPSRKLTAVGDGVLRDQLMDDELPQQAPVASRGIADHQTGAAPEPRLAIGLAAHPRQDRPRDLRGRPEDLVNPRQLDLELDDGLRGRRVEHVFEAQSDGGEVAQRRVVEVVIVHDAAERVDGDPRRASACVEKVHAKNCRTRTRGGPRNQPSGSCAAYSEPRASSSFASSVLLLEVVPRSIQVRRHLRDPLAESFGFGRHERSLTRQSDTQ